MPSTYNWATTLDNTQPNQVLIGASATESCSNLADAINANPDTAGTAYSLPTQENSGVTASASGTTLTLTIKTPGSNGNAYDLTATGTGFSWSAATPSGGTDGTTTDLSTGVLGVDAGKQVFWTQGSRSISTATAPSASEYLYLVYYRLGSDVIAIENTSLVTLRAIAESSTGMHQQMTADTSQRSATAALVDLQRTLTAWSTIPAKFGFAMDHAGYLPGQQMTVALTDNPRGASTTLNGTWILQEIHGQFMPCLLYTSPSPRDS